MIEPYYAQDGVTLYQGDVLALLDELPPESVDCVVTSPPYWSLRKYSGDGTVWGGDPACQHEWIAEQRQAERYTGKTKWQHIGAEAQAAGVKVRDVDPNAWGHPQTSDTAFCRCGARRGQYGLEPTPELYVEHSVMVLRAIRRVLRPTGTVWWNVGDSYAGSGKGGRSGTNNKGNGHSRGLMNQVQQSRLGLKPKDLCLIPFHVAIAAQRDGWWVRSDIIWSKPNPMPESVTDRPTKSHEYVLLLAKSDRYFFDQDAVREPALNEGRIVSYNGTQKNTDHENRTYPGAGGPRDILVSGRNIRSVWNIATQPSPLPHFASFPEELAARCIKAGCPADGIVLDPFAGTGTTLKVARDLGRQAIGTEISAEYCELARKRLDYGVRGVQRMERGQGVLL